MAFTSTMTLAADVDDSLVTLWDEGIILGYTPELITDQVVTVKRQIGAKLIQFTKYSNLALATSALDQDDDPSSVALVDTAITLEPAEHGNVVTRTSLANLQTGGKVDTAAALLIGRNMGATIDKLAITAAEAFSTDVIYPAPATSAATLTTGTNLDHAFANRLYNRLARNNVPGFGAGTYVGIAHDDCLYDLRDSLIPVKQYADLTSVLANEVGMAAGIRWLRSSNVTITANSSGTIDSYKVNVFGMNSLGKAVSEEPHPVLTSTDKLGRFVNFGWYGCFKYGVIDTGNMVQGIVSSSVGAN